MTEKTAYVRLPKPQQDKAKERAREQGVTLPQLYANLLQAYSEGAIIKRPPALAQSDRAMTRVVMDGKALARAKARAAGERRALSDVLEEILDGDA